MRIDIMDLQDMVRLDKDKIKRHVLKALKTLGEEKAELSLLFVNDSYIKRLNHKYRGIDSKTDVLAFPMREGEGLSKDSPILGDVAISIETAKREAKKRKSPFQKELDLYLAHGILHLLGYDDENPGDRKKMQVKEAQLVEAM